MVRKFIEAIRLRSIVAHCTDMIKFCFNEAIGTLCGYVEFYQYGNDIFNICNSFVLSKNLICVNFVKLV